MLRRTLPLAGLLVFVSCGSAPRTSPVLQELLQQHKVVVNNVTIRDERPDRIAIVQGDMGNSGVLLGLFFWLLLGALPGGLGMFATKEPLVRVGCVAWMCLIALFIWNWLGSRTVHVVDLAAHTLVNRSTSPLFGGAREVLPLATITFDSRLEDNAVQGGPTLGYSVNARSGVLSLTSLLVVNSSEDAEALVGWLRASAQASAAPAPDAGAP
jgi:hypothetical protein